MNILLIKKWTKLFLIVILIILIGIFILFLSKKRDSPLSSVTLAPDLFNHPIYSLYQFNQSDSVINIGIQPLYLPTGIIFEVIKRDNILNRTLSALGKEIKYYPFLKGTDINFFLQQKMLNAGVGGDMPVLSALSSFDVVIPVLIQKGNASIVSKETILTNDLKGKRIAYPHGSISHYFILELLHSEGIDEEMVRLIPMEISSMAEALHNDKIDLFSNWEPNVSSALKQYPEFIINYQQITTGYLYFLKDFVQKNQEITNHILAAVIRSISWMKSDYENLLLACEWSIAEMEIFTEQKSILTTNEIADLVFNDILIYDSKYSIIIKTKDIEPNSSLHKEYEFLNTLNKREVNVDWQIVAKSFDNNLINEILDHPKEFHLNEYDYVGNKE